MLQGYFAEEQITLENLSQVADYLYRGDSIKDTGLQTVANRILVEILGMEAKLSLPQFLGQLNNNPSLINNNNISQFHW